MQLRSLSQPVAMPWKNFPSSSPWKGLEMLHEFMILPGATCIDPSSGEPSLFNTMFCRWASLSGFLADLPECQIVSLSDNDLVSLEGWRLPRSLSRGCVRRDLQDECTGSLGCDFLTLLTFKLTFLSFLKSLYRIFDGFHTCSILADAQLTLAEILVHHFRSSGLISCMLFPIWSTYSGIMIDAALI